MLLQRAEKMKSRGTKTQQSPTDGSLVAAVLMDVSPTCTCLAPSDFCLFSPLKKHFGGHIFQNVVEI
jgi:hypothetical protein